MRLTLFSFISGFTSTKAEKGVLTLLTLFFLYTSLNGAVPLKRMFYFYTKYLTVYRLILFPFILFLASCNGGGENLNENNNDSIKLDSLSWFNKKVEADPTNLAILFERAKFHLRKAQVDLAQSDLETYLKKDSSNFDVHKLYADIMMAKLNLEQGKYHYEYILTRDSSNTGALIGMGKLYALLDNSATALVYLNEALRVNPYLSEPYFMKGMLYRSDFYKTGREESWNLAVSSFQTAVEQDPNNYSAYVQLGVMYDQIGDSTALDYYNSALDIFPESIEAWYNKGMFYQNRNKIDEALQCYRTLHEIDSTWADPYYNEGYVHLLITEEIDSAIFYFGRAVECDPTFFQAYNNLGLAYEKKNEIENAKFYYQKAIEINPDFQLAKDNLNRLQ